MARESFSDRQIAELLNRNFISVKVDKEERPDIDSVYMSVCQSMTGSGGWPLNLFLTPDQKPFFAGTYFPPDNRYNSISFHELLTSVIQKWTSNRTLLELSAKQMTEAFSAQHTNSQPPSDKLFDKAAKQLFQSFDPEYGGFGKAPKFPIPHNLLFLLDRYSKNHDETALNMAEITLDRMYRGGLFDHIGFGFCRYSTDRFFLVPHFEKMLYDNAMLISSYSHAYDVTGNQFYLEIAGKTADYVLREMTGADGGFYSAQDADSDGVEGKFYTFAPEEILQVLGKGSGALFNQCYDITKAGNFEGQNIPNLKGSPAQAKTLESSLTDLREYRRQRTFLHLDDKILTAWNALMIAAFAKLYRVSGNNKYQKTALCAEHFLSQNLCQGDRLFVSFRNGETRGAGYLDDYAFLTFAMLELYQATQNDLFLNKARRFCSRVLSDFLDEKQGGFFLSGRENERLIFPVKETYDGAIPSGNSVMAYNLVRLSQLTECDEYEAAANRQLEFMAGEAQQYPAGYTFYLLALSAYLSPPNHLTVVLGKDADKEILHYISLDTLVTFLDAPAKEYPLINNQTTYYLCKGRVCLLPVNELPDEVRRCFKNR